VYAELIIIAQALDVDPLRIFRGTTSASRLSPKRVVARKLG